MKNKFLIRLDDACPSMNNLIWTKIEKILDKFGIKPMVGIIPSNADSSLFYGKDDKFFWKKALSWNEKGWSIALHGYDHCYLSNDGGINPLWKRSEFAGLPLCVQKEKIRKGYNILLSKGLKVEYFFAPSHTFDENTLQALKECSPIRVISDTIALKPYRYKDFIFIPQQFGHFTKPLLRGVWTFCFHPNEMSEEEVVRFEEFIKSNRNSFIAFSDLDLKNIAQKSFVSKILSILYFARRRIKNLS